MDRLIGLECLVLASTRFGRTLKLPKMKIHKSKVKNLFAIGVMLGALVLVGKDVSQESRSASLSNVSVTLSNSRLSFRGLLAAGNTDGSSQVTINVTPGDTPSTSSAQLQNGDAVLIGEAGSLGSYTVTNTTTDPYFTVDPGLLAGDADSGDDVVATQSATHTVRFTTTNAVANGSFRILVPAHPTDAAANDGIPDGGYFDYGTATPTVTCPTNLTGYTFTTGTSAASSVTIDSNKYHAYECEYTGTGAIGTVFDGSVNDAITIDSIINPAPDTDHTLGTADSYKVVIQHLNASNAVVDTTTTAIGVIEAVKVSASVAPQISFRILGVASSTSACGVNTNVATTPTAVPFGELSIDAFTNAAQTLAVSTNAINGYTVTAIANDQLGKDGGTCLGDSTDPDCIPDSKGNGANMTHTASSEWTDATAKGFAYSLHDNNTSGLTPAFQYNTASGNCTGTYCARQFADDEDSTPQDPVQIFSHNSVADNQNLMVCYRAIISAIQAAGDYENYVTYTATATF